MRNHLNRERAASILGACLIGMIACMLLAAIGYGQEPKTAEGHLDEVIRHAQAAKALLAKPDPQPEPQPEPEPQPDPGPAPTGTPYFALQPGRHGNGTSAADRADPSGSRLVSEATLRKPWVAGLTIRRAPDNFLKDGKLQWGFWDQEVAKCRRVGKPYTLLLYGNGYQPLSEDKIRKYETFAAELGARYSSDPLCWGVHCVGATVDNHSEERFWGKPAPRAFIDADKRLITAWAKAFPKQVLLIAGSGNDLKAMREIVDFAQSIAPGRVLYKGNAMSAKTPLNWDHNQFIAEMGTKTGLIGWEMLGSTLEARFGDESQKNLSRQQKLQVAVDKANTLAKQAGVPLSYLAVYLPDLDVLGGVK